MSQRKLHLGCGHHLLDGWINTDYDPDLPNADQIRLVDATREFPFIDDNFDFVFTEHLIEHITWKEGMSLLRESYRVLKPGGVLRVTTPSLDFLTRLLVPDLEPIEQQYLGWATKEFLPDAPYVSPAFVVNNFVRDWGHQFIYDAITLKTSMAAAGFTRLQGWDIGHSLHKELQGLENESRMPEGFLALESFTLEGTKPNASSSPGPTPRG